MSTDLDSIVSVDISADSKTPTRAGFGTPLVMAYHTRFVDNYREYASLSEMSSDGFVSYDDAYRMAAACFAQNPAPETVIVGRLPSAPAYTNRLEMQSAVEGASIELTYLEPQSGSAIDIARTVPAASSVGAEATAVAALINAVDVDSLATAFTTSTGVQTVTLNGVIGSATMARPFRVTATLNSHADWDATSITVTGLSTSGALLVETLTVPNGGNATLTSASLFKSVASISVPAQSGTNGTATFGTRAGIVGTVAATSFIDVTPLTAGRMVHCYDLKNVGIEETTADAAYDTELSDLELENDDWYFILTDSSSPANVADVADWVLTRKKLYFAATNSSSELAGTGTLGYDLSAAENDRTVLIHCPNSYQFGGARWVGMGAAKDPGSITWALETLTGLTPKRLTTTQKGYLEADNINHYQTVSGLSITRPGKVASGEWIDIMHGLDALEADIQETFLGLVANRDKVPFTAAGLDLIGGGILASLRRFEGTVEEPGLIEAGTSYVTMPEITAVSSADKIARRLTGVRFGGTLAGAIHSAELVGSITSA